MEDKLFYGAQYYGTGKYAILITLLFVFFILWNIHRSKKSGGNLYIRRIAGLNAIEEAIGRATEMGRPVMMVPGLGGLNAIAVQALNIFSYVTQVAGKFATPIRVCCGEPAVFAVAQEMIRDVFQREGIIERYQPDTVQFLSDKQFAFAAGVAGIIHRDKVAATFLLGEFFAESLIFAESANSVGAIQVAGTTRTTQTPFFIAACDYVLIGDEYYAASAYLTREPVLVGSLIGQDWVKLASIALLFIGLVNTSLTYHSEVTKDWDPAEGWVDAKPGDDGKPRKGQKENAWIENLMAPKGIPAVIKDAVEREKRPPEPNAPIEGGTN